jgi:cold shock CspA family protein
MPLPLQIAFHNLEPSEVLEALVRERAAWLDRFAGHVTSCRVVIAAPHRRHRTGNLYLVRIDLALPGGTIAVNRGRSRDNASKEADVAVRNAFDDARRQLEDHVRRRRGAVKAHEVGPQARVLRLFPGEGYGFLETPDGREIYFHRRSVLRDAFDRLQVGAEVAFTEEEGKEGPQASTVRPVGRHNHL